MERRALLKLLCLGATAAFAASPARAFTRLAPVAPPDFDPTTTPQAAVATPEDIEQAKIEQARWRRRRWRRYRRYYRRYYYYRPRHYYRRHYWRRHYWW
jgi:hypothetical protein